MNLDLFRGWSREPIYTKNIPSKEEERVDCCCLSFIFWILCALFCSFVAFLGSIDENIDWMYEIHHGVHCSVYFFLCKLYFLVCVSCFNAFLVVCEEFTPFETLFASYHAFFYVFLVNVLEFIFYAPLQLLAFVVYSSKCVFRRLIPR